MERNRGRHQTGRGPGASYDHTRAVTLLTWIFGAGVLVSIVHYTDNYANYMDYPQPTSGLNPPASAIGAAWFLFTAAGVAGYLLFRRAPSTRALVLVAVYSGSGLVGIGHYLVPGAMSMPWWRHAHVIADVICGVAILSFAVWALLVRGTYHAQALTGSG